MATKTLLTIEEYAALDEPVGVRYELSEGDLIVTPSASYFHNKNRDRLNARFQEYLDAHTIGDVISEMDMRLGPDIVRRPDVAFIRKERLEGVDLERIPLPIAPDLVIEIVSNSDGASDLNLKVSQYLEAGVQAVWLLYPRTQLAYRHVAGKLDPEGRSAKAGGRFEEPDLLPGFSLPLADIFR
jgi:Uma2 family endonuclease